MKAKRFTETRTVKGVLVETDAIAYRDGKAKGRQGIALGPVVKVTALTPNTARAYGFPKGEAYSIKEYGADVRHVGPSALIICEGREFYMRDFYAHARTL